MEIKCCMIGCDNVASKSDDKSAFFVFPRDFNLCMLWVQNSGRPEYFEDFAFAGAQPFLNRHICSSHFNETDFVKNDAKRGLLPGSVPYLNLIFQRVDVKEEITDPDYSDSISSSALSESELLNEINLERIKNGTCKEFNTSLSFSSADDSCNDLHGSKLPTPGTIDIYKETDEDKELSKEFFKKYETAMRSRGSIKNNTKRSNETEEDRALRLKREALRAKIRRSRESDEQKKLRRMKNALRAAFRRQNESPEQRELRKKKDKMRSQRRRKAETEAETRIRRYNDAVRAAFRRNNETEEQRMERKMKDIIRAAKRRSLESPEQRAERLKKDRERASKRRMLKKITEQMTRLDGLCELRSITAPIEIDFEKDHQPLTMSSIGTVATQCNESSNIDHLQQVLEFIENNTSKFNKKTTKGTSEIDYLDTVVNTNNLSSPEVHRKQDSRQRPNILHSKLVHNMRGNKKTSRVDSLKCDRNIPSERAVVWA